MKYLQTLVFAVIACFAETGLAQTKVQKLNEEAALRAASNVVAEYRIYATCLALDPIVFPLLKEGWTRSVKEAWELVAAYKPSPFFALKFNALVDPAKLLDQDMKLSAAMEMCHKNYAVAKRYYEFGQSNLAETIQKSAIR